MLDFVDTINRYGEHVAKWFNDTANSSIFKSINDWIEPARTWLDANHNNPVVWSIFFLIGLAVFAITYSALNRNG